VGADPGGRVRTPLLRGALVAAALAAGAWLVLPNLRAQEPSDRPAPLELPTRPPSPAPRPVADPELAQAATADDAAPPPTSDSTTPSAPVPLARYAEAGARPGEAAEPGAIVELDIRDDGEVPAISFRWVQVEGPPVAIPDPARRAIEVQVPRGCDRLAFLRIATAPGEVRVVRFVVPVRGDGVPAPTSDPGVLPRADAGDDQVGLVGHRVTLNGSRSVPASGVAFRWLQVGGPPVVAPQQDRGFFSFVPTSPGLYQFALVLGGDRVVSEPDTVSVLVGSAPAGSGLAPAASPAAAPAPPPPTPESLLAAALPRLEEGARIGSEVADVFEAVADRSTLYSTFGDLQSELSRRLDVVIPLDPARRSAWSESVLQPLTLQTIQAMAAIGVDVRQPAGLGQPLSPAQRERMQAHFRALAEAFRNAAGPVRR
jgi:hypothetical protein